MCRLEKVLTIVLSVSFLLSANLYAAKNNFSGKNSVEENETVKKVEEIIPQPQMNQELPVQENLPVEIQNSVSIPEVNPVVEEKVKVENNPVVEDKPVVEVQPIMEKTTTPEILPPVEAEPAKINVDTKPNKKEESPKKSLTPLVTSQESKSPSVNMDVVSTTDPNKVLGKLKITETPKGLLVEGKFSGVPGAGKHGIHVHEFGSCADQGNAAGSHFNPDGRQHGCLANGGHYSAHAGDMGNVEIDDKGNGDFSFMLNSSSLQAGRYNVAGKSIILHEKEDDFSQPTGNAGGRIGCGIIPSF